MQARASPEDTRLQQDLSKIIAPTEYLSDATLNATKFASRALASNVTSRQRLLWLHQWQADMRSKWRLATAPFKGQQLFGEVLDPFLVEGKDKRKVLLQASRRTDRRSTPFYRRQLFRTAEAGHSNSHFHRQYFHNMDRYQDRSTVQDRARQVQSRRPFRGAGGRPYHCSK